MDSKRNLLTILFLIAIIFITSQITFGRSVYVISDTVTSEIQAYNVDANSLTYQADYICELDSPDNYGAVGIAIDESEYGDFLFVTFEDQDEIELINAKRMQYVDAATVSGAQNLADVAMDIGKSKLYAVRRYTNHLYSYSWDALTRTLTPDFSNPYYVELEGLVYGKPKGAFGIALDEENGLLYVADNTDSIKDYNTNDWSKAGQINDISCNVIGIAIDVENQLLYYGSMGSYGQGDPCLYQYDISSSTEQATTVGSSVGGIAVDQETSFVYITTFEDGTTSTQNRLMVYDGNLTKHWSSDEIGNPAGVAVVGNVSCKPHFYNIVKDDNDVNCVEPFNEFAGNWLYYNIAWDANGYADSNVVIVDYLPDEVDEPNMISDGGVYDGNEHTVKWTLGSVAGNDEDEYQIRVGVNHWARPGSEITNEVEIEGDEYLSWRIIDTNVCAWGTEIIYVDKDANGFNNGTSWDDAYTDWRDAFTGAENLGADVNAIWVAAGTYKPVESTEIENYKNYSFELIEDVGLFGHFGGIGTYEKSASERDLANANNETILDGKIGEESWDAVEFVITANQVQNTIIDGFTIQGSEIGAGIYLINGANVGIVNCKIKNNHSYGVHAVDSYLDIHNCLFTDNAIDAVRSNTSETDISYCIFNGNDTTVYGLWLTDGSVNITDSNFENHNTTSTIGSAINGGGPNLNLSARRTVFKNNDQGIELTSYSSLDIEHCVIRKSDLHGIDISVYQNSGTEITNSWIHNNGDAGIYFYFKNQNVIPEVRNNTIYGNDTYGIQCSGTEEDPNIRNCIITGNDEGDLDGSFNKVNYCLLQSDHNGVGNLIGDPGFMNIGTDANDLHLDENSQCKNNGDSNGIYDSETDIDGEGRVKYGRVDIGGDEYYWSPADFDEDEKVDFIDYDILAAAWQSNPNDNDYNEVCDLNDNNIINIKDLALFCKDWLWEAGWVKGVLTKCMGGGGFGPESMSLESSRDALMLSAAESLRTRPERLVAKSQKFYDIRPVTTISARREQFDAMKIGLKVDNIKRILQWLDEAWLNGDLKEHMTEEQYLEFRKIIEEWGPYWPLKE
jgi:hypothetical protein